MNSHIWGYCSRWYCPCGNNIQFLKNRTLTHSLTHCSLSGCQRNEQVKFVGISLFKIKKTWTSWRQHDELNNHVNLIGHIFKFVSSGGFSFIFLSFLLWLFPFFRYCMLIFFSDSFIILSLSFFVTFLHLGFIYFFNHFYSKLRYCVKLETITNIMVFFKSLVKILYLRTYRIRVTHNNPACGWALWLLLHYIPTFNQSSSGEV